MLHISFRTEGVHTLVGDRGDFYCSEWEWINKTSSKYEGKKGAFGLFSKPFTFDYALTSKRTVMKPICHLTHAELVTKVTYRFFRHSHSLQSDSPRSLLNKPTSVYHDRKSSGRFTFSLSKLVISIWRGKKLQWMAQQKRLLDLYFCYCNHYIICETC